MRHPAPAFFPSSGPAVRWLCFLLVLLVLPVLLLLLLLLTARAGPATP